MTTEHGLQHNRDRRIAELRDIISSSSCGDGNFEAMEKRAAERELKELLVAKLEDFKFDRSKYTIFPSVSGSNATALTDEQILEIAKGAINRLLIKDGEQPISTEEWDEISENSADQFLRNFFIAIARAVIAKVQTAPAQPEDRAKVLSDFTNLNEAFGAVRRGIDCGGSISLAVSSLEEISVWCNRANRALLGGKAGA